jgi:hypothetical protein
MGHVVEGLSGNFYIRLIGESVRGTFDEVQIPRFDGYRCSSYIQYNEQRKHFRYIKVFKDKVDILDGTSITSIVGEDINAAIGKGGWNIYICGYERKDSTRMETELQEGVETIKLSYERIITGGMYSKDDLPANPKEDRHTNVSEISKKAAEEFQNGASNMKQDLFHLC